MDVWIAKGVVLVAAIAMVVLRAPHGHRSRSVPVAKSRKGRLEVALLVVMWISFFLPIAWIAAPWFSAADFPLRPAPLAVGVALLALGLWLFHRSHVDLGRHWSITLELREKHELVQSGLYRSVRHPMYTALLLYGVGQALVLPNWIAGPSYLVAMVLLVAVRVGPEERMMIEQFGDDYHAYARRTKRLIPGIW